jgi:hypothetical protein
MANDHRITVNSASLNYTCQNRAFQTNLMKGVAHGAHGTSLGSVFNRPPIVGNNYSLWLEHVIELATNDEYYWLMWYDLRGWPAVPLSAVFTKQDLQEMVRLMADFVP